jgi:hypothetical protein
LSVPRFCRCQRVRSTPALLPERVKGLRRCDIGSCMAAWLH